MITLDDCAAFCDADPDAVERLARDEHLAMPLAFAMAQACGAKSAPRQVSSVKRSTARMVKFSVQLERIAA